MTIVDLQPDDVLTYGRSSRRRRNSGRRRNSRRSRRRSQSKTISVRRSKRSNKSSVRFSQTHTRSYRAQSNDDDHNTPPPTPRGPDAPPLRNSHMRYMNATMADSHPLPLPRMMSDSHIRVPRNVNLAQYFTSVGGLQAGELFVREKLTNFVKTILKLEMPENLHVFLCSKENKKVMKAKLIKIDNDKQKTTNACGYLVLQKGEFETAHGEPHVVFYTYVSAKPVEETCRNNYHV